MSGTKTSRRKPVFKLDAVGEGSKADEWGYDFDLLVGWLEDIKESENDKADEDERYRQRAEKLEEAVCMLQDLQES